MPANQTSRMTATRRRSRWGRRLLLVIVLFLVAGFALTEYAVRNASPPSAFQTTLEQGYANISKAAVITGAQIPGSQSMPADEVFRATAAQGLQRLDDPSIMTLIRLRADLADRTDPKTCAALWSGDNVNLVSAIESLPDDQQQEWAQLFDQAAAATVNNVPIRQAPSPEQYQEAFNRTMAGLGPSEFEEIENAVANPDDQSPRDECIAARLFYGRLKQMSNADALIVTRSRLYR
jgi:hypothetical protein